MEIARQQCALAWSYRRDKKTAPTEQEINAPAFIARMTPINGGLLPILIWRLTCGWSLYLWRQRRGYSASERGGFRIGNEVRVNTDLEYVYCRAITAVPGKRLFVIMEAHSCSVGAGVLMARSGGKQVNRILPGARSSICRRSEVCHRGSCKSCHS